jgi:hypothetical protein
MRRSLPIAGSDMLVAQKSMTKIMSANIIREIATRGDTDRPVSNIHLPDLLRSHDIMWFPR